ncbi:MAG: sulfatase-like hydrolase/transferase, partial [Myxococcales bacterium]|nr:sulfatase-like hydrolase/transferase [Myxococcales bacterium]
MHDDPGAGRRFWTLLRAMLWLAGALFAKALVGLVLSTRSHGDDFTEIATGQFLGTLIMFQVRVIPAYLVVALAYAVLLFPFLQGRPALVAAARKRPGARARLKALGLVAGASVLLGLLSVGPFFTRNPGLLDGLARKMGGRFDWYALHRWHLLDAATIAFGVVVLIAALFYGLRWWRLRPRGAWQALWIAPLLVLAGGAAFALRSTPAPPAAADTPPNVLIIASDSLRYDRLGVHGHDRDVSPHIDAFARQAVDFQQMHVATASTLESWVTLMSSRLPPNHGVRYMYLRKEQAEAASKLPDMLPRLLNAAGYATIASSNWAGNCFALVDVGFTHNLVSDTQNFDAFIMETTIWTHLIFPLYFSNDFGEMLLPEATRTTKYLRPSVLVDKLFDQVDDATRAGQPFFGLLFFSTTHLPYTASYPFNVKYVDPAYHGQHQYEIEVTVHDLITTGFDPDLPADTIQHIRDLYDGTVSEFDHYVGETLRRLDERGLADNTIVIITSDHGEDLYDPGSTLGHGTNFLGGDQSTRIPFFLRAPGLKPGVFAPLVRNLDVGPTLLALLGLSAPASWTGVDLTPGLRGEVADFDLLAFAETCYLFFP